MKRRVKAKSFSIVAPIGFWDRPLASLVFIIFSLILLLMSGLNPSIFNSVRATTANAMSPVISLVSYPIQEGAQFVRNISGLSALQAENAALQKENDRLREWYQTALTLEDQNKALRDLLNVKLEPQYNYITARLIADVGSAFVKSLLVKAGHEDGVQKGQAVISGDGLLGRIIGSSEQTARVLLITDLNSRVPVIIEGSSYHAILAGRNSSSPVLEHLPNEADIQKGARIVTSGKGGLFPAGLPVGVVTSDPNTVKPEVQLFVDFNALQFVRVVAEKEGLERLEPSQAIEIEASTEQ